MVNLKVTRWGIKHKKTRSVLHLIEVRMLLPATWNYKFCIFIFYSSNKCASLWLIFHTKVRLLSSIYRTFPWSILLSCKHIQMLTFPWSTFIGCYHIKTLTATYLMCVLDIAACFVDSEEMFGVSCTSNVWYYMHFKKTVLIGGPNKMSNIHLFLRNLQSQNRKTW